MIHIFHLRTPRLPTSSFAGILGLVLLSGPAFCDTAKNICSDKAIPALQGLQEEYEKGQLPWRTYFAALNSVNQCCLFRPFPTRNATECLCDEPRTSGLVNGSLCSKASD